MNLRVVEKFWKSLLKFLQKIIKWIELLKETGNISKINFSRSCVEKGKIEYCNYTVKISDDS